MSEDLVQRGRKNKGVAGVRAPNPRRPRAENVRGLGAKGTKEQGFAGICAPSPRRPHVENVRRLGAKGTEDDMLPLYGTVKNNHCKL